MTKESKIPPEMNAHTTAYNFYTKHLYNAMQTGKLKIGLPENSIKKTISPGKK